MVAVHAIVGSNEPLGVRFNETSVHCDKVMGIYTEGKKLFVMCLSKNLRYFTIIKYLVIPHQHISTAKYHP